MIERVVGHLADHGVDEAVLSLGYRPDAFAEAYPDGTCAGVTLHYAVEPEPLDTAGAIRFAAARRRHRRALPGASTATCSPTSTSRALVAFHDAPRGRGHDRPAPGRGSVRLRRRAHRRPTAGSWRSSRSRRRARRPTDLINAGTYVLEPSVLDRIADGRPGVDRARDLPGAWSPTAACSPCDGETYWIDTGTPETYLQAQLDLHRRAPRRARARRSHGVGRRSTPTAVVRRSVVGTRRRHRGRGPASRARCCWPASRCEPVPWSSGSVVGVGAEVAAERPRGSRAA